MKAKATEEAILAAAMKVFTRRGYAAARTEEIAREAGINRALLHYYYRDKETIFNLIFETRFREFFSGVFIIVQSDQDLFSKIRNLVNHEIDTFAPHPDLARFVISEIAQQPERLLELGAKMNIKPHSLIPVFESHVEAAAQAGLIRPISGRQLLINIMSLCIYPFVASPIIRTMMQVDEAAFADMMTARKNEVYDFIINAIKK